MLPSWLTELQYLLDSAALNRSCPKPWSRLEAALWETQPAPVPGAEEPLDSGSGAQGSAEVEGGQFPIPKRPGIPAGLNPGHTGQRMGPSLPKVFLRWWKPSWRFSKEE